MKYFKNFIILLIIIIFLFSCETLTTKDDNEKIKEVKESKIDKKYFPALALNSYSFGEIIQSPILGDLIAIGNDPQGGKRVIIEVTIKYYYENNEKDLKYQMIIGSLLEVSAKIGKIKEGDPIGKQSGESYIIARVTKLDPFLVITSENYPYKNGDYWWISPDWLIYNVPQRLSFREVDSLKAAVEDFYNRWAREREFENKENLKEKGESIDDRYEVETIHFFPDLDRIRTKIVLNEYPKPIEDFTGISTTEKFIFNSSGFNKFQSNLDINVKSYDVVLLWQTGFDEYLKKEYKLGNPIWIYGSIMTLDHINKRILVFVRDFSSISSEEEYKLRMNEVLEKNKGR